MIKSPLPTLGDDIATAKSALRCSMRQVRASTPVTAAESAAELACAHALALPELRHARVVGVFAPIGAEIDCTLLNTALIERGVTLAFPRVIPGQRSLLFQQVDDPTQLIPSSLQIPEPDPSWPVVAIERFDVLIVPGLAFDRAGHRLGWGAGHYDATLNSSTATRVGYAFDSQLISHVPSNDFDIPMNIIVTEAGAHRCVPTSS